MGEELMTYQIAYGVDTDSLEDPGQLSLLTLPDRCMGMDGDELVRVIQEEFGNFLPQPLVGVVDVMDALRIIIPNAPGVGVEAMNFILNALYDTLDPDEGDV